MSEPRLFIKFVLNPPPAGFESNTDYEVIRTIDAVAADGRAILNFLITNGGKLIFVPSDQAEVANWSDFNRAVMSARAQADIKEKLIQSIRH